MANLDEILKKSQEKLKNKELPKKIKRDNHSRPWREEGLEFGQKEIVNKTTTIDKENKTILNEVKATPLILSEPPTLDIPNSKLGDLNESTTNLQQTYNNSTSNLQQTYNKKSESYNKLTTQPTTVVQLKPTTIVQQNLQQNNNKPTTNLQQAYNSIFNHGINRLAGLNLILLRNIFEICLNEGSRITGPLNLETLTTISDVKNSKTTQTLLYRLEKQGYLIRNTFKAGRGGWTSYEIPTEIYNQLLQYKSKLTAKPTTNVQHNLQQTYNKSTSELATQLTTNSSSKIDSKYNNTNYLTEEADTTPIQSSLQNIGWFKSLDFSAIPYIKPMMVNSVIRTLVESKLDPDDVQMFLNKFKNWLVTQSKIQNPLAIFCDKLKEYANEGDSPVLSVMSDEELQVEYLMAQDLEKKRVEMDLINKARAFKQDQDKEALFQDWFTQSTDEEKRMIYPETAYAKFGTDIYNISLKEAFLNQG